jgi:hypothetical protein
MIVSFIVVPKPFSDSEAVTPAIPAVIAAGAQPFKKREAVIKITVLNGVSPIAYTKY